MTIHRDGWDGPITFECDGCGAILETRIENFHEALREAKDFNWRVSKVGPEWIHICSHECLLEARRKARSE